MIIGSTMALLASNFINFPIISLNILVLIYQIYLLFYYVIIVYFVSIFVPRFLRFYFAILLYINLGDIPAFFSGNISPSFDITHEDMTEIINIFMIFWNKFQALILTGLLCWFSPRQNIQSALNCYLCKCMSLMVSNTNCLSLGSDKLVIDSMISI